VITIRPYHPSDFQAVLSLINTAAEADRTQRTTDQALRTALTPISPHDSFAETALITAPEGTLAGFAWWQQVGPRLLRLEGWVHPHHRRKGIGTALLDAAEAYARKMSGGVSLAARAYEDIPGVAVLFQRKKYSITRRFYMMSTRLEGKSYKIDLPQGVRLRSFNREDLEMLVEADNELFGEHWGSQARGVESWKHDMIDMRPHDPSLWIVAWAGENIVGECLCHVSRQGGAKDAWVSTVGIRREWRGRGLGRAVLAFGLEKLQASGFETASLHVDSENISAVNLYRSLEMDVVRTRLHFARTLGG
jgi:mycothiol synthase